MPKAVLDVKMVDPTKIDIDIRKRVMSKVANVVRKHIRRETPKRKGKLRNSISKKVWDGGLKAAIYSKTKYAHLVLYGTRAHDIPARKGHYITIGGHIIGSKVHHPGARANDFFTRGAENSRSEVEATLRNSV